MDRLDKDNQHEENEKSKSEKKREDVPDTNVDTDNTIKESGVTSAFSAATQQGKTDEELKGK
jgi:hypothetical protein